MADNCSKALFLAEHANATLVEHLRDCSEERRLATIQREEMRTEMRQGLSRIHARINTGLYAILAVCVSGLGYFIVKALES